MTISQRLADWGSTVDRTHTPAARAAARHAIQDLVGCMVAGAGDEGAAAVRRAIAGIGEGEAVVCGRLAKAPAPYAALANGMAAHSLDFDDTFMEAISHASATLVPALLALGDETGASGRDIVDAYIVGLEFHGALGLAMNRSHYEQGWHATSSIGVVGTAGACARLMGLDAERFAHALGLAVSSVGGTKVQFGSMAKPYHAGLAAKNAMEAAKAAEAGVRGHDQALEGPMGMMEMFGGPNPPGWEHGLATLGDPLAIERAGLAVKRFPCCAATHRALDCILMLMDEHGFGADEVAGVDVRVRPGHVQNLRYTDPVNEFEARFSMQYTAAVALTSGTVSLSDFTPSAVRRPELRALFDKVTLSAHDLEDAAATEADPVPSIVAITLEDGRTVETRQHYQRGDANNPLNAAERQAKFDDCCRGFLADADLDALAGAIATLDDLPSIRDLTRLLRFEAGADRGERFERRA